MEVEKNNIADKIASLLLNYDLTISYVQGEIDLRQSTIDILLLEEEKKSIKKKIIKNRADIEVFETFLNDLLNKRKKLTDNINLIFERYDNPSVIQFVFFEHFIKRKSISDVAASLNLPEEEVLQYKNEIEKQLIDTFNV